MQAKFFTFFADAVAHAHTWHGRCSVLHVQRPAGDWGYEVISGNWPDSCLVTIGTRYALWEQQAAYEARYGTGK